MGAMVATSSLAKITGPLLGWHHPSHDCHVTLLFYHTIGDGLYIAVDRRTWLIMGVLTLFQLIVLIGFVILYRTFKPKKVGCLKANTYI